MRHQIDAGAKSGPRGATGPRGPAGTDGASAGARRINYDAAVSPAPVATTIAELPGLTLLAACYQNGANVNVALRLRPTEDAVVQSNFTLDTGADPASPPPPGDPAVQTGNGQIALSANTDNDLGGPGTQGGTGYVRVIAHAIVTGPQRTFTLNVFEIVNANTSRCTLAGTILPST